MDLAMRLAERKYRALFLAVIALTVLMPILRATAGTRIVRDVVLSVVFLVAIFGVVADSRLRLVSMLLGIPTLVGLWTGYALPDLPRLPLAITLHSLAAVFFGFMIGVILRDLRRESGVSIDSVFGAFCGYLLVGLAFGHLFCVLEALHPGSFRGEGLADPSPDQHHFLLVYFSFLTLTTVGYGDIVPGSDAARGLVVVEAIIGQFYIAVLVAELIGRRASHAFAPPEPGASPAKPPPS